MVVKDKADLFGRLQKLFLKEASPFSGRREVHWARVKAASLSLVGIIILLLLILPTDREEPQAFSEQSEYEGRQAREPPSAAPSYSGPLPSAGSQMITSPRTSRELDISRRSSRDSSMILSRDGVDSRSEIPAGILVSVKLRSKLVATSISLPVIGEIAEDILHEGSLALPAGTKIFGTVSFDGGTRALVAWNSVQLDGRKRKFSALGIGQDMQAGVEGEIGSDAGKNVVGQALSRFIGAYAEGSMERGIFGGSSGGSSNGWKSAVAEVAKTQADGLSQDLQKERRWIEIDASEPQYAILTEPFVFRDPGGGFE